MFLLALIQILMVFVYTFLRYMDIKEICDWNFKNYKALPNKKKVHLWIHAGMWLVFCSVIVAANIWRP